MSRYRSAIQRKKREAKAKQKARQERLKKHKRKTLILKIKHAFIWGSIGLFAVVFLIVLYNAESFLNTPAGSAAGWSAKTTTGMLADDLPLWFWVGLIVIVLWMWKKHKLIMPVVLGIIGGIVVAILL